MSWYERRRGLTLDDVLLRSRRNVYITLRNGCHVLVGATVHLLTVHLYLGHVGRCDPDRSVTLYFAHNPHLREVYDGQGWNLALLLRLVRELTAPGAPLARPQSEDEMKTKYQHRQLYLHYWRSTRDKQQRAELKQGSCLVLRSQAVREVIPAIPADLVKLWLLAITHVDDLGVAFPGVRQFMEYGYHPKYYAPMMDDLVSLGLMRWLRKGEKDPITRRQQSDVFQAHPALVFVRKRHEAAALAMTDTPFAPLPDAQKPDHKPDHVFPSIGDRNQRSTNSNNQRQLTNASNQQPTNHQQHQEGENNNAQPARSASVGHYTKKRQRGQSPDSSSEAASARSATRRKPPSPRSAAPPSPPREKVDLSPFQCALPDELYEKAAVDLHQRTGGALSHPWARYLVKQFGCEAARAALATMAAQPPGTLKNPAGYVRRLMERKAVDPAADGRAAQRSLDDIMNDPDYFRVR